MGTSLGLPRIRKPSAIFGDFRKIFGDIRVSFEQVLERYIYLWTVRFSCLCRTVPVYSSFMDILTYV